MTQKTLPLRKELRGQESYGAPQIEVPVKLNTNENPFAPSPAVVASIVERVTQAATGLNRYPDRTVATLRAALSEYIGAATSTTDWSRIGVASQRKQRGPPAVVAGFRGLRPHAHWASSRLSRCIHWFVEALAHTMSDEIVGKISPLTSSDALDGRPRQFSPTLSLFAHPTTQQERLLLDATIAKIADAAPGIVIVDEAYGEFSTQPSAVQLLSAVPESCRGPYDEQGVRVSRCAGRIRRCITRSRGSTPTRSPAVSPFVDHAGNSFGGAGPRRRTSGVRGCIEGATRPDGRQSCRPWAWPCFHPMPTLSGSAVLMMLTAPGKRSSTKGCSSETSTFRDTCA